MVDFCQLGIIVSVKKWVIFLASVSFVSLLFSQPRVPEAALFQASFDKNIAELYEVYQFRGANFRCDYQNAADYAPYIFKFLEQWEHTPRKPVVLFYSKTSDSLRMWLFASDTVVFARRELSDDSLAHLETMLRNHLLVRNARGETQKKCHKRSQQRGSNIQVRGRKNQPQMEVQHLSDLLLPVEFRPILVGKGHVFIVPEQNIGQIPFWMLEPFGNGSILADSMSYSHVPHVCDFENFVEDHKDLGNSTALKFTNPLIVGNPSYDPSLNLPGLPGAEKEAAMVAELLDTVFLTGENATIDRVKYQIKNADLIYLATHAHCDMEDVLKGSYIALAPTSSSTHGKLTLYEVQRMMLPGKMAVLSACETGYGKVLDGGFVGLGRAFFKAGIDFTVMSLWSVNDEATYYLMSRYMQYVLEPNYYNPAEPLRRAILDTRKEYPDPVDWAAFQLFGFTM